MENKMDSLFKKKLENNSTVPREDAWVRVEANLPKKNNAFAWRIAAALLIAGALITLGLLSIKNNNSTTLGDKSVKSKSKSTADSVVKNNIARKGAKTQNKNQVIGEIIFFNR